MIVPIGIMHADRLLPLEDARLVAHHTRLVERGLAIQNEDVTVPKVPVHLLVDSRSGCIEAMSLRRSVRALLWR